ncbi:hypothetical protein [Mesorhizobium sp.]|uniref:hypothetical protein n=1 Tax=Mesorhizobium sp. TaxID=1871066 RepID=UPI0025BF04A6|nr:hypothetical protein [Mesorhizobium sp.]
MPARPGPRNFPIPTRESIRSVLTKWMDGNPLTASETALVMHLRAVNMAQQLASAVTP